mmetsp:Transcript_6210/g.10257  ORF Transcript_6210/g.10257 Transcript_6210/m.10257 type:complete len:296 (+) Transcript_6210:177-1064(+)
MFSSFEFRVLIDTIWIILHLFRFRMIRLVLRHLDSQRIPIIFTLRSTASHRLFGANQAVHIHHHSVHRIGRLVFTSFAVPQLIALRLWHQATVGGIGHCLIRLAGCCRRQTLIVRVRYLQVVLAQELLRLLLMSYRHRRSVDIVAIYSSLHRRVLANSKQFIRLQLPLRHLAKQSILATREQAAQSRIASGIIVGHKHDADTVERHLDEFRPDGIAGSDKHIGDNHRCARQRRQDTNSIHTLHEIRVHVHASRVGAIRRHDSQHRIEKQVNRADDHQHFNATDHPFQPPRRFEVA